MFGAVPNGLTLEIYPVQQERWAQQVRRENQAPTEPTAHLDKTEPTAHPDKTEPMEPMEPTVHPDKTEPMEPMEPTAHKALPEQCLL
jgi:hypothetical protein